MNPCYSILLQFSRCVHIWAELDLGSIRDVLALVRRKLWFEWLSMSQPQQQLCNVTLHQKAAHPVFVGLGVVPLQVNTYLLFTFPILRDLMVPFENRYQVQCVIFSNVFQTKIIHDKDGLDGVPGVSPQVRSGAVFIVTLLLESSPQQVVG